MHWITRNYHHFAFIGLLIAFTLVPISLWLSSQQPSVWLNPSGALRSVGQLAGILGASLFSLNFIFSARLSWIEEALQGLPRVYTAHHFIGIAALILLLTHPLGLGLQYLPFSINLVLEFFLPDFSDYPKLLGVAALSIIIGLLWITLFVRIAYHRWKSTHKWLGLALFIAAFHVFLIPGHLDAAGALRLYMIGLMLAGLMAFSYRTLFGRWLVKRSRYQVVQVKQHSGATEIILEPEKKPIDYQAGQFVFIGVTSQSGISREAHPFSITSAPGSDQLAIAAKSLGDYTATLSGLAVGTSVEVEGPYGRFIFSRSGRKQIWIAGGIGITPFMSYIRSVTPDTDAVEIQLYYLTSTITEALFVSELEDRADSLPYFTVKFWESASAGRFDLDAAKVEIAPNTDYFICGPASLMTELNQQLQDRGIKRSNIHLEEFKLY